MAKPRKRPEDLREACVEEALAIIGEKGLEALSLREVARRLQVSHQAPYKHFASRDHILAEVVRRAFASFAKHLDRKRPTDDADADLSAMGLAYLEYARKHPLHYKLMFETTLPEPDQHPEMLTEARHSFALLHEAVLRLPGRKRDQAAEMDAMYVWSAMHGLASILRSDALGTLKMSREQVAAMVPEVMKRVGLGLGQG